ncbi:engulfment and cell motility protein 2-like [Watersipora subatra]|uniref:engulfment and cell motility protein 2-like n=1 Tax=Watersipora subatra TaxID=2589382 RepID=UPI00355B0252
MDATIVKGSPIRPITHSSISAGGTDSLRLAVKAVALAEAKHTMKILDKQNPLVNIVRDLCEEWRLDNPEDYQLQFDDAKITPPPIYVTEENREKMADGDILKLDFSPQKMSQIIIDGLQAGKISQGHIERLALLSADITFVEHFVTENGLTTLNKFISSRPSHGEISLRNGFALDAFLKIMNHFIVSWDTINNNLLSSVIWHIEDRHKTDLLVIKSALMILDAAIRHSSLGKSLAQKSDIDVDQFISTLKTKDVEIQVSCISLINTILGVSSLERQQVIRKRLLSNPTRQLVWENIFTGPIGPAMEYQLYSLQTRLINLLSDRYRGAIKKTDPAALKEVTDLRLIAFDTESENQQKDANDSRDFTRLGFKNPTEPLMEFSQAPPGALTLDCMAFFAHQYTQQYRQVVLENSRERADEQDCPFAQASVELTQILADILKIGRPPSDEPGQDDRTYYPMFFYKERPFEECFCVCIQRLMKTWKEMKASLSDFSKVLMVVREQITRALESKPPTFDSMKNKLGSWSFAKIQEARQKELEAQEERKRQAKPIQELCAMIQPELEDVIKQQRINRMIEGCLFKPIRGVKNARHVFCRLSHNAKVLHYGMTATDQGVRETPDSINILDIERVSVNEDGKNKNRVIVIARQGGEELLLNGDTVPDSDIWLDGLNALTGNSPIVSKQAQRELNELLSLEVKLRLLDAEGIEFPSEPPPIPDPPANFNFVTA